MHGDMVDIYTPRVDTKQFQVFEKRLRHVPVKRIAPYPTTSSIIAQPKRSRMVCSPLPKARALSLRPVNVCIETKVNLTQGPPRGNNYHMPNTKVNGMAPLCQSAELQKSLPFDQIRFVNNSQQRSYGYLPSTTNDKFGCCPLRTSTTGYSTPPYCTKPPNAGARRVQRNPKLKAFKVKGNDSVKNAIASDVGCLDSVKTAALTTIKVATNCVKDQEVLVRESATSSEDCRSSTKVFEGPTASTALVSSSSGSVKTTGSSQRYSCNFNPQMTSTPQRSRHTTNSAESSSQFKKPYPPKTAHDDDDLSMLLRILEEERKVGKLKMLPLEQLAVMTEKARCESDDLTASLSTNYFDSTTNNNNSTYLGIRNPTNMRTQTYKLPAMHAIGAPKAASSPIISTKIMERSAVRFSQSGRRRHHVGNDSTAHTTASVPSLWRPW